MKFAVIIFLASMTVSLGDRPRRISKVEDDSLRIELSSLRVSGLERPLLIVEIKNISSADLKYQSGAGGVVIEITQVEKKIDKLRSWLLNSGEILQFHTKQRILKKNESIFKVMDLTGIFGENWKSGDIMQVRWDAGTFVVNGDNGVELKMHSMGKGLVLTVSMDKFFQREGK